jgi:hypothetical protein
LLVSGPRRVQLQLSSRYQTYQTTGHENPLFSRVLLPDLLFVVYGVFVLETLQTALSGADLYYWFASGFGNVERLLTPFASFIDVPILGSVVSLCVQFFFMYRIWMLSEKRSWWLCVIICLVTSSPKSPNNLIILHVALHCWRIRGVRSGYLCEPSPFHVT